MDFPKDPVMLLSVVNTYLRDYHSTLEEFCENSGLSVEEITNRLAAINYHYDPGQNQFR